VRRLGALGKILLGRRKPLDQQRFSITPGMTPQAIEIQANAVKDALHNHSWNTMKEFDLEAHSWSAVASEWVEMMNLKSEVSQTA
jgi:hypothetical protein